MLTDVSKERAVSIFWANIYQGTWRHVPDGNILFALYMYGCKTWSLTPKDEIGCRCWEQSVETISELKREEVIKSWSKTNEKLANLRVNGRSAVKWILKKYGIWIWNGFMWLTIWTIAGVVGRGWWIYVFHKGNAWPAERLLATAYSKRTLASWSNLMWPLLIPRFTAPFNSWLERCSAKHSIYVGFRLFCCQVGCNRFFMFECYQYCLSEFYSSIVQHVLFVINYRTNERRN
jgi:hypothetical protein